MKLITIPDEAEISETCWNKYLSKTIRCIVFFVHKMYLSSSETWVFYTTMERNEFYWCAQIKSWMST